MFGHSTYVNVGVSGRIRSWKYARSFTRIQRFRHPTKPSLRLLVTNFPPIRLLSHNLPKNLIASGAADPSDHGRPADRPRGSARPNIARRFGPPRVAGRCERSRRASYRSSALRQPRAACTLRERQFVRAGRFCDAVVVDPSPWCVVFGYVYPLILDDAQGSGQAASPAASRRPDRRSSRCSGSRKAFTLVGYTARELISRSLASAARASLSRPIWA